MHTMRVINNNATRHTFEKARESGRNPNTRLSACRGTAVQKLPQADVAAGGDTRFQRCVRR